MNFQQVGDIRFLTFDVFSKDVVHGVFTRRGGLSPAPWSSLNVGGTVGDESERVVQNRYRCFDALGRPRESIFDVWQVHSADVIIANLPGPFSISHKQFKADGIITNNPSISLFMRFADCVPILLYDPRKKVVGLVHAGWQGTVKRAAGQAIKMMQAAYGSIPHDIHSAIGPSIGPDHYEVGSDVLEQVKYSFGIETANLIIENSGHKHFDLWAANKLILQQAGVESIEVAGICTACNPQDWYSHRGQKGKTGRFGALISIK